MSRFPRFLLSIGLILFLGSAISRGSEVSKVEAEAIGTIYIRADGTIDPPTAPITTVDNVTYAFAGNVNDSIVVERDSITIDGQGYSVQGTGSGNGITLSEISNVTVKNTEIRTFSNGIRLDTSFNDTISGSNITNNGFGIWLADSSSNVLSGNIFTASGDDGLYLLDSSGNLLSGNVFTANNDDGIKLISSSGNTLSGNNVTANNDDGIELADSSGNVLSGNVFTANNDSGVVLSYSSDNILFGNNVTSNGYGVYLYYSSDNIFYHNNFLVNTQQVQSASSTNVWDDGYPSGGNYWSDFKTRYPSVNDTKSGPYQNVTGSDGIWDSSYVIDANNKDDYPIVPEFSPYLMIPLFMMTTLLAVKIHRRKRC